MNNWQDCIVPPDMPVVEAMKIINSHDSRIVLVAGPNRELLGAVTDGDIRRGLLCGLPLSASVLEVANTAPLTASPSDSKTHIRGLMESAQIRQIPLIKEDGQIVGLVLEGEVGRNVARNRNAWVMLMVGGQGKRLRPLTENTPKPMLLVGNKPILETILENLVEQGFRKFFLSVHYKADTNRSYFGDGEKWGVEIHYVTEQIPLGTAGALTLLSERPPGPIVVMNGDLLTKVDFGHMLDFHKDQGAAATMGVREYDIEIEYGVVEIENDRIARLKEKPIHQFLVNAGIYILEPNSFCDLPKNSHLDMPSLFQSLIDQKRKCAVYPIVEYWLDIGRLKDFEHAKNVIATL